jgi:hypothetical protein
MATKADFAHLADWCLAAPADAMLTNVVGVKLAQDDQGDPSQYVGFARFKPAAASHFLPERFDGVLRSPEGTITVSLAIVVNEQGGVAGLTIAAPFGNHHDLELSLRDASGVGLPVMQVDLETGTGLGVFTLYLTPTTTWA